MITVGTHINCFIVQEMSNGTRDNAMLSCTVQTYFFLRHSLHNTGNGFIWFLVFLIKSKALKEKVFLLHFTFFSCTFVFHKLYFPKLKMGTGYGEPRPLRNSLSKVRLMTFSLSSTGGSQKRGGKNL